MKSMNEMDLDDEWELIPDEGYLEINDDGGNKIYSRKHHHHNTPNKSVFQMNYFICPQTQTPHHLTTAHHPVDHHRPPLPIVDLQPPTTLYPIKKKEELGEKVKRIDIPPPAAAASDHDKCLSSPAADPTVSQVFFFNKMKEVEFVDMKMDSPKSGFSKGIVPQSFDEKAADPSVYKVEENFINQQQQQQVAAQNLELEERVDGEDASFARGGGVNIWKLGLNGIGAICSFGVAAATVCIIILGTKNSKHHHNLHFQLYTSTTDKKMKQVFGQTSKLNETISAMRGRGHGVPSITTAHITFGGYYDAPASL